MPPTPPTTEEWGGETHENDRTLPGPHLPQREEREKSMDPGGTVEMRPRVAVRDIFHRQTRGECGSLALKV